MTERHAVDAGCTVEGMRSRVGLLLVLAVVVGGAYSCPHRPAGSKTAARAAGVPAPSFDIDAAAQECRDFIWADQAEDVIGWIGPASSPRWEDPFWVIDLPATAQMFHCEIRDDDYPPGFTVDGSWSDGTG